MEIKKIENLSKRELIVGDLYSRPNAMNGKYSAAQIGLDDPSLASEHDIFFLETLKVRADSADRIIAEAEAQGQDTSDLGVMKELGEKINALGEPIHRKDAIMTAIIISLKLMIYYGVAIGIWGLVFKKSFFVFGFYGLIVGLLISLFSAAPVVSYQRTKERIRNISFGIGATWGNLARIIGAIGLVALVVSLIFF